MTVNRHRQRKPSPDLTQAEEGTRPEDGLHLPHRDHSNSHQRRHNSVVHRVAAYQHSTRKERTVRDEVWNMALLVVLYAMQGVPLGLTMGAMPFLLQSKASYTQIGIFSVASYPYSFKLLWSPIVDSCYSLAFGRRKSWVVPIQLLSALLMIFSADAANKLLQEADVVAITTFFFVLVMLAATQDIAVDGWALTLLSRKHVGYASTCQTMGMNVGYFTSFTVFLALNDPAFCNKYLRAGAPQPEGLLSLAAYLRFWGWFYLAITLVLCLFKKEANFKAIGEGESEGEEEEAAAAEGEPGLVEAYSQLWRVVRLPAVRRLTALLLTFRLAVLPAESAAPLKLLEKGVSKEALAGLVLLEFPCELVSAVLAGRWATAATPFVPWMRGYWARLLMAGAVTTLVYHFPADAMHLTSHPKQFLTLAVFGLVTSFTSTLMFTALGSFYNRISDPDMGGAYLTLLNTIANMGVILPKLLLFMLIDLLSERKCRGATWDVPESACPANQAAAAEGNACTLAGGKCIMVRDGFYMLSYSMLVVGLLLGFWFRSILPRLESLPIESWRAKSRKL